MFFRMIRGAIFRQKKKMVLIAFVVMLGTCLSTGMLNTMLGIGDKVNRELKAYGANINVVPKESSMLDDIYGIGEDSQKNYLKEDELGLIKTIFWSFNIVDYTPYLNINAKVDGETTRVVGTWFYNHMDLPTGEAIDTGMRKLKTWWNIEGEWIEDKDTDKAMVGTVFALRHNYKLGDKIKVVGSSTTKEFTIAGIFDSGSDEDSHIYLPLKAAQELDGVSNVVSRVEVSALTTPDNDLARKAARNPKSLTIKEWEVWYCTAYVSAICYQIQEVMTDSIAKPIRQVAESEGDILNKTTLLMVLITALSLIGSALAISNLVTASVMERRAEIGLQKAIGANNTRIITRILVENISTGIMGGTVGYFIGLGLTQVIGITVFGSGIPPTPMVIPIVIILILLVIVLGSIPAIRYLLKLNPTEVLHGKG